VSGERTVEATGETVGEAGVRFQVLSEGERGLLGVGYTPARVMATAAEGDAAAEIPADPDESEAARRLRALVTQVASAIGVRCRVDVHESETSIEVTCTGEDLGLLIGRHGQTIDAVQVLASALLGRNDGERKEVVVDASGYRERRRRTLESLALRSAEEATRTGARVELESMSAAERKIVHTSLEHDEAVTTSSEGEEPNRFVVVEPAA
jgi:spoIIIJ-associated protein